MSLSNSIDWAKLPKGSVVQNGNGQRFVAEGVVEQGNVMFRRFKGKKRYALYEIATGTITLTSAPWGNLTIMDAPAVHPDGSLVDFSFLPVGTRFMSGDCNVYELEDYDPSAIEGMRVRIIGGGSNSYTANLTYVQRRAGRRSNRDAVLTSIRLPGQIFTQQATDVTEEQDTETPRMAAKTATSPFEEWTK